jgi:mycofactocin glycosyltransferase
VTRPAVTVVIPFGGGDADAALRLLQTVADTADQAILSDNAGTVAAVPGSVELVRAGGERSPAHARNAGAARATHDWILFLDADTIAPAGLLQAYFAAPVADGVGVLVGEIEGAPGARTLAGRYGASKNFLSQRTHMAHPFRPRAAAANLLVRREAFEAAGGFREGLRAAEDTDFCWRLQDLGWTLELRPEAAVQHEYRETIGELRRQWRAYAAGRAWLATQYPAFHPQPALVRALRRSGSHSAGAPAATSLAPRSRRERLEFLAIDVLLGFEELIGFRLSNRPPRR